jgi:PAS domain S-box-containing protein
MRKNKTKNKKTIKPHKKTQSNKKISTSVVPPKKISSGKKLYDTEEVFRTLAEASLVGVYIYQDGIYTYINPKAAEIMGYTVEETEGKVGPKDIALPEDIPFLKLEIQKRLSGEVPSRRYEVRATRKDKKIIYCEVYDSRITFQGKPAIMGSFIDITVRKEAEEQLRESEEKFRTLTEASLVGVYIVQDNTFKYVNPMAAQIFGYSAEEVIDKIKPEQVIIPEEWPFMRENIRRRIEGEVESLQYEFHGLTKDKRIIDIEVYGSRIMYHGKPAIVGSVIDITERNRAAREKEKMQAQVFQLQKMEAIGIMTSGVAHDLNNILTVIQGHAELGIIRQNENKPIQHDLEEILDASIKGTSLTHQLLLFGRKSPLELVPVNINTTVNGSLKMLKRLIGENIKIVFELADDIWMIMADTGNIQQVIMNLVINASDAIVRDGTITIKTENSSIDEKNIVDMPESHPGNYVCLTVTDTGTGIDNETINRIFEPFFTTKGKEKGTGLGLSVVYGIAKQHNGWVNVYSTSGNGTTFKVYFPAVLNMPAEIVKETLSFKDLNGNGERILLVEDEESMLNFVKIALNENGYTVFPASSAQEAVKIFKSEDHKFDLVFSDVVLPDSTGIRLIEELLSYKPGFLCLLTSGYTDEKSQWASIKEKGYPFIQKPYTLYDLFRTIKDLITTRAQIR